MNAHIFTLDISVHVPCRKTHDAFRNPHINATSFSEETENARRYVGGYTLAYTHANGRTFSERGSFREMRGNDSEKSFNTSVHWYGTRARTYALAKN